MASTFGPYKACPRQQGKVRSPDGRWTMARSGRGFEQDLDPDSEEIVDAADAETPAPEGWQRYGVESYVCLQLLHAAKLSISTGAAIAFT
ncbi:hypothetical protein [Streptomyces sp. PTD5-9]|uniref:hypothetical protein n=1 Tax=Streptomyces sp. PTD5-9 TaxID=3120150 RepID=UPI00300A46AE